jgi:hypothetical protein
MKLANGRAKLEQWVRDKSAKLADMKLGLAEKIIDDKKDAGSGDGPLSKYQKANAALIKKLLALPAEDIVEAANATITELQAVIGDIKPGLKLAS